jgi:hypothetical protein
MAVALMVSGGSEAGCRRTVRDPRAIGRTTGFATRIALAIAVLLVAVPIASGKGLPVERQQQCSGGGSGAAPALTRVTVDGVEVPVVVSSNGTLTPAVGMGRLYATAENNGARLNGTDCLADWV